MRGRAIGCPRNRDELISSAHSNLKREGAYENAPGADICLLQQCRRYGLQRQQFSDTLWSALLGPLFWKNFDAAYRF
jgi:hypothetical protein